MGVILNRKLYLNADKSKVVEENSPDAAFVLGGEGSTVSDEDMKGLKIPKKFIKGQEGEEEVPEARPLTTADIAITDDSAAQDATTSEAKTGRKK